MEIGVFARTFSRPTLEGVLDAVLECGLEVIQFNFSCAGLPTLPAEIDGALPGRIRGECEARGIAVAAVSGTFNLIDPDLAKRREGLRRLGVLAPAVRALGAGIVTLSTGTRHPEDLWAHHPANASAQAWRDLLDSLEEALEVAEAHDLTLAFEPETANVVSSARAARRLLDELGAPPRLRVVIDAANLFSRDDLARMRPILEEAFELLGRDIALAHAKEITRDGEAGGAPAGSGLIDWQLYLDLLGGAGYDGPLVLHGLEEEAVEGAVSFLRGLERRGE